MRIVLDAILNKTCRLAGPIVAIAYSLKGFAFNERRGVTSLSAPALTLVDVNEVIAKMGKPHAGSNRNKALGPIGSIMWLSSGAYEERCKLGMPDCRRNAWPLEKTEGVAYGLLLRLETERNGYE